MCATSSAAIFKGRVGSREDAKARRKEGRLRSGLLFRQAKDEGFEWLKNSGLVARFVFDLRAMGKARWFVVCAAHGDVRFPISVSLLSPEVKGDFEDRRASLALFDSLEDYPIVSAGGCFPEKLNR
jgi:hypothetical protein